MKVLIVTQYFPPEPVQIPADVAQGLAERGHEVQVLTGFPNYPLGKITHGYSQRWRTREKNELFETVRVPLYADHSVRVLKRVLNYVSFALSSSTARKLARDVDVVYVYATQMTAAFGPWLWRLTGGKPYVLHVQDLWPDSILGSSLVSPSKNVQFLSRVLEGWLRSVYHRASGVIAIAPTMLSELVERGVPDNRGRLIYNWSSGEAHEPIRSLSRDVHCTNVVYAGNIGDMQDLETVVRAAHAARDAGILLSVVGDGVARVALEHVSRKLGADNVSFVDPVPREEMVSIYSRADFGVVSLKNLAVFRGTIPSKLQALLAVGLPVISTVQGDVRSLVEEAGVGLTADAEDVRSLELAFRSAAELTAERRREMSDRARELYHSRFSRTSGLTAIESMLMLASEKGQVRGE